MNFITFLHFNIKWNAETIINLFLRNPEESPIRLIKMSDE